LRYGGIHDEGKSRVARQNRLLRCTHGAVEFTLGLPVRAVQVSPSSFTTYQEAREFMSRALLQVHAQLPSHVARAVSTSINEPLERSAEESTRVALWNSIAGREQEYSPEVLCTRAAICVLYGSATNQPDPADTIECFLGFFRAAGLAESALSGTQSIREA
jgi:hypothetical protein